MVAACCAAWRVTTASTATGRSTSSRTAWTTPRRRGSSDGGATASWSASATVGVRGVVPDLGVPFIGVDNRAVADMAADHLRERGLRHFGFCGLRAGVHPHLDDRREFFVSRIQGLGHEVHLYETKAEQSAP